MTKLTDAMNGPARDADEEALRQEQAMAHREEMFSSFFAAHARAAYKKFRVPTTYPKEQTASKVVEFPERDVA